MPDIAIDKAKWHYEGRFPNGLPKDQAYVHIGFVLGWLADNDAFSEETTADFADELQRFRKREMTATTLAKVMDGAISTEMCKPDLAEFLQRYYKEGPFYDDYSDLMPNNSPSLYHMLDLWSNYQAVSRLLSRRFTEFQQAREKRV